MPQRKRLAGHVVIEIGFAQKLEASTRKLLARSHNPDAVVGELEMRTGKLDLGHVTGDTEVASDWTGFVNAAFLFFGFRKRRRFQALKRPVAREAFRIIVCRLWRRIFMWVMTSCAGQSHVGRIMSTAGEHPIRLKADGNQTAQELV